VESLLEVLDRLERVLRRHMDRLPLEHRKTIEREVLGLLHMARAATPRELHRAASLQGEAEAALARAREEARRLVLDAQAHARSLSGARPPEMRPHPLMGDLEEARREADRIRRGADEYAAQVLERLAAEVERVLATIRRAQDVLPAPAVGPAASEKARRVR
jgi:hypothetical protein